MNAQRVTVKSNGRLVSQLSLPVDVAWVSALLWPNLMHYTRNVKDSKKYIIKYFSEIGLNQQEIHFPAWWQISKSYFVDFVDLNDWKLNPMKE